MQVISCDIPDVKELRPARFGDERGYFAELYSARKFAEAGISLSFVQDNIASSREVGTVRGLHFQKAPFAQDKLVWAIRGRVLDVVVDIRRGSPTYGRHVAVELSAAAWNQLLVPAGFAHGYCTLEPDSVVMYKVTAFYSPQHEGGLLWNDPVLGIAWPLDNTTAIVNPRDRGYPTLDKLDTPFDLAQVRT